jgi:hypothetical protein
MKKLLPMREELKPLQEEKPTIRKINGFRAKITPYGIEDFKKGDTSKIYRRGETVWYKANSTAKPEIITFRNLPIWSYNEFVSDIEENEKGYRIFYNPIAKKFFVNEIVSYNYKGIVLLKNPVDKERSEQLQRIFIKANLPKNKRLDTIAHFRQAIEKFYNQKELESQLKKRSVGNQPKVNLMKATLWCIKNHPKNLLHKRQTLLRAYKRFGEKTQLEDSFVTYVRSKWTNLIKEYGRQAEDFKKQNSLESYAKTKLRIPRNTVKQRTNENVEIFK